MTLKTDINDVRVGDTIQELPEKGTFGVEEPFFTREGWDETCQKAGPEVWTCIREVPKTGIKGGLGSQAYAYNKKYKHLGFIFEARTADGVYKLLCKHISY
tara:strand:+ start:298 stop:600 length:303 start_codon:yes stop_codon:yes gene_type:complete